MAKWADYGISKVRYDSEGKHIDCVMVRQDLGEKLGAASEWYRASVISKLEEGTSFITILERSDDRWKKGKKVHIIEVNQKKYIRTDTNKTEADNLGELPTF